MTSKPLLPAIPSLPDTNSTRLNIALLTYSTQPRGSVIHTLELATALHELGHRVCVMALDKDSQGFSRDLPCEVYRVPAKPAPTDMDQLIQQRIQELVDGISPELLREFDIYHAQDCLTANALILLRQKGYIPHVVRTVHHIEAFQSVYLQQCQERSIREADRIICVSQQWQDALCQHYQIHATRVTNGVNLNRFSTHSKPHRTQLKQQLGLTGSPIYLTVGGIEPRKNSIHLLQAFAQVRADLPSAQLIIAGGATLFDYQDYRTQFFAIATELGIRVGESLILPGVVPDAQLPALYQTADAFVFPSLKEGWGLVVLEAIAAGLPVITSDQPPFTEFLSSQQALLVDPEFPSAIAQAMRQILQPSLAHSLIRHSQSVLSLYPWERSALLHQQCYQALLADHAQALQA